MHNSFRDAEYRRFSSMSVSSMLKSTLTLITFASWFGALPVSQLAAQNSEESLEYRVGQRARTTIYASDTIRLSDPGKHPDVFTEVRNTIPPLFGYRKIAANEATRALSRSWNDTRDSFLDSLQQVFGKRSFRTSEITSGSFQSLIDSFQATNRGFPVTDELARRWAVNDLANDRLGRLSGHIEDFMTAYFIRPENNPAIASISHSDADLITIADQAPESLDDLNGFPQARVAIRQFLSMQRAQQVFSSQTRIPDQAVKAHLTELIRPNIEYLESLSIQRWVDAQSKLKNEIVFEKGSVVVEQGQRITPVIKEALDHMIISLRYSRLRNSVQIELAKENPDMDSEASTPSPRTTEETTVEPKSVQPARQEIEEDRPKGKLPPLLSPTTVVQSDPSNRAESAGEQTAPTQQARTDLDRLLTWMDSLYRWLIIVCIALLIGALVFLHFRNKTPINISEDSTPAIIEDGRSSMIKTLASNLTQTLFRQRQTLLKSKESATAQVAAMEDRLAKLQPEIFDKLKAYEEKIKDLEDQLEHQTPSGEGTSNPLAENDLQVDSEKGKVERLQFEAEINGAIEEEETDSNLSEFHEDDKAVPFPSHAVSNDLEDEVPAELMEEVLEDLEAEEAVEKRIAKGSES